MIWPRHIPSSWSLSAEQVDNASRGQTAELGHKVCPRKNGDTNGWSSISFLLKHRPGESGGNAQERPEDAIKSMKQIEDNAENDLHPGLDLEFVDQSRNWTGWGYARREPNDEVACER